MRWPRGRQDVALDYFLWDKGGRMLTHTATFRLAGVTEVGEHVDRDLVPSYPGITETPNLSDWDPPFPIDLSRVGPGDDDHRHPRSCEQAKQRVDAELLGSCERRMRLMAKGTVLFVHGTGVRLKDYRSSFADARKCAAEARIEATFVECAWGDPLGVEFEGLSLPDPSSDADLRREEEDFARWSFLFADPLFELDKLTLRDVKQRAEATPPGRKAAWEKVWTDISEYEPQPELRLLLRRGDLEGLWPEAWSTIVEGSTIPKLAFQSSAHEIPDAANALARAVVAQLHVVATANGKPGPSRGLREKLVARLLADWNQQVYGLGTFLASLFKRAATRVLRNHRNQFSDMASLPIGDILLYQTHGEDIRAYIRKKIAGAAAPVSIVSHSLGGIACVDLLALPDPPPVARLVTVGSQSPLLYEIGAMTSLKRPDPLPPGFPPWLNVYDRNDFLSYRAGRLFPKAKDFAADSGQPFPDSHSAYFGNEDVWNQIRDFGVR